jgi:hypothetical protein
LRALGNALTSFVHTSIKVSLTRCSDIRDSDAGHMRSQHNLTQHNHFCDWSHMQNPEKTKEKMLITLLIFMRLPYKGRRQHNYFCDWFHAESLLFRTRKDKVFRRQCQKLIDAPIVITDIQLYWFLKKMTLQSHVSLITFSWLTFMQWALYPESVDFGIHFMQHPTNKGKIAKRINLINEMCSIKELLRDVVPCPRCHIVTSRTAANFIIQDKTLQRSEETNQSTRYTIKQHLRG